MKEQEMALRNIILKIRIGSHLYGTTTENSDEDFSGIFVPDPGYVLGLKNIDQVDLSTKSKDKSGKNTKDAVDCVLYSLEKFVRLLMNNNPNILEFMYVNDANILQIDDIGRSLMDARHIFLHKGLYHRFCGYAYAQKHKMVIKTDKFHLLQNAYEYLCELDEKYLIELKDKKVPFIVFKNSNVAIGDLNFKDNLQIKRVILHIKERLNKVGNRKELILKHGWDCKFGSHLIRLLTEGVTLLKDEKLEFPLPNADLIRDIKCGKWKLKKVLDYADSLEADIEQAYEKTHLPHTYNMDEVNELYMELIMWSLEKRTMDKVRQSAELEFLKKAPGAQA